MTNPFQSLTVAAKTLVRSTLPRPMVLWLEHEYYRRNGEVELVITGQLCRSDRDALDIGANEGCYIHFMRGKAKHVHAFEPVPWLADRLTHKFGPDLRVHPVALSDAAGEATLSVPMVDGRLETGLSTLADPVSLKGVEQRTLAVQVRLLDEVYDGSAGLIKIDVEGHEEAVLAGGLGTIARCRPNLLIEIEERHTPGAIGRIRDLLDSLGYQGHFIRDGRVFPIEAFDPLTMQRSEDIARFGPGDSRRSFSAYINNFLFLPREDSASTLRRVGTALDRAHIRH